MALKVKAVEKKIKFSKEDPGVYRYVMQPDLYIALSQAKVIREAALRSGVSQGVMKACWDAAGEVIKAWATEGHSVALPGLGTMRFGLRAKSVVKVEDVKTGLIKIRRIIFTPSQDLKDELADTAIQITCYDRNGKIVKRVTSADAGTVEDNEEEQNEQNGTGSENEQNQGSGSEQSGSGNGSGSEGNGSGNGSSTGSETVEVPTISGETPFDESTQVTISGPDGAEIRYTIDGTAPNAQSPLYSEALTLTDTTTVKAIAIKDGEISESATKVFTKNGSNVGSGGFETGN
ncbi:MAG: chitobiase/beta-hexosaminidase C-terminal domain-containing protein [Prevotella sp.]|nr:chitobiase/beta-hexosaminidase C-terminal domain-containing protein [Prevotella sp.]